MFSSCISSPETSEVIVLYDGYSKMINKNIDKYCILNKKEMSANCTCTLIIGRHNIIVDTMTAWDSERILNGLKEHNLTPDDIHYVISTHGHSDHIGNNNLFLKAKHIVGFSISFKDKYYLHPFATGEEYIINKSVKVIPTPGHTLTDVTVLVSTGEGKVAITGDLFEKMEDIEDPVIWKEAGSEDSVQQTKNRYKIASLADWIIPGHGSKFEVDCYLRDCLQMQEISLDY